MRIESITFRDFRNYEQLNLDEVGDLTVFTGHNAVGKTNVLEGIQLLTSCYSFRHPQISQLVRDGSESGLIAIRAGDGNRSIDVSLAMEAGKRRYSVNGKAKPTADVRGVLPSIMFTPDDLQLVKRSSSIKRNALDDLGTQLTRSYYVVRRDFEKIIRYKNRLLRDEASRELVESINETLVTCGAQLFCLRIALFDRMVPHVARVYEKIAGPGSEGFTATYRPSWQRIVEQERMNGDDVHSISVPEAREIMRKELERWYGEERRRTRCLIGPHNDEISFELMGRDAAAFASQGQQRSIVLAWRLAEVAVVREVLGVSPVLLLDDVLSELDESRREMLVRFVTDEVQTFVTATDLNGFSRGLIDRAQVIKLPL